MGSVTCVACGRMSSIRSSTSSGIHGGPECPVEPQISSGTGEVRSPANAPIAVPGTARTAIASVAVVAPAPTRCVIGCITTSTSDDEVRVPAPVHVRLMPDEDHTDGVETRGPLGHGPARDGRSRGKPRTRTLLFQSWASIRDGHRRPRFCDVRDEVNIAPRFAGLSPCQLAGVSSLLDDCTCVRTGRRWACLSRLSTRGAQRPPQPPAGLRSQTPEHGSMHWFGSFTPPLWTTFPPTLGGIESLS